jgi:hypothetical protein
MSRADVEENSVSLRWQDSQRRDWGESSSQSHEGAFEENLVRWFLGQELASSPSIPNPDPLSPDRIGALDSKPSGRSAEQPAYQKQKEWVG